MNKPSVQRLFILVGLILIGFALRLYRINVPSLRGDEAFTVVHWMRTPLAESTAAIATIDPQPPLAYALFRVWWLVLGDNEYLARYLPALLNLIGIAALYALGKRLSGARVGLVAALLWTVHPFQIWHAQDARNYAIWSAASVTGVWLALRAISKRRPVDWMLYIAVACLAAYIYYLELFVIFTLMLYVAIIGWRNGRLLRDWIIALVMIGLVLAPWYVQPRLLSGGGYGGTTGGFQAERLLTEFLPALNFGLRTMPFEWLTRLWLALLPVLMIGGVMWWRRDWRRALLPTLLAIVPALLLGIVSTRINVFAPRYVLGSAPAFALIVAYLVIALMRSVWGKVIALLLLVFWLGVSFINLANHCLVHDYAKSPDWRAFTQYIEQQAKPTDIIVQRAADEALNFYYDEYNIPFDRKQLPANPTQSEAEITGLLEADSRTHSSIWLVAQTFPDWPSAGIVEGWIAAHMQTVRRTNVNGIPVEQYKLWEVSPDELDEEPLATFEDVVELRSANILAADTTGDHLTIWLYWQPLQQTDTPLKIFVHLLNPGSPPQSQADQFPQSGRIATDSWHVREVYRDVYEIPLENVPAGDYDLVVGFYDPATGERLAVGDDDSFSFGTVTIP
jgi:hypothetical protein